MVKLGGFEDSEIGVRVNLKIVKFGGEGKFKDGEIWGEGKFKDGEIGGNLKIVKLGGGFKDREIGGGRVNLNM